MKIEAETKLKEAGEFQWREINGITWGVPKLHGVYPKESEIRA